MTETDGAVTGRRVTENFEQIRNAGATLLGCGEDFEAALGRLVPTLRQDNPWGADEPGTLFGASYNAVLGKAMQVLESHLGMLYAGADGLRVWADRSANTESVNQRQLDGADRDLGR